MTLEMGATGGGGGALWREGQGWLGHSLERDAHSLSRANGCGALEAEESSQPSVEDTRAVDRVTQATELVGGRRRGGEKVGRAHSLECQHQELPRGAREGPEVRGHGDPGGLNELGPWYPR